MGGRDGGAYEAEVKRELDDCAEREEEARLHEYCVYSYQLLYSSYGPITWQTSSNPICSLADACKVVPVFYLQGPLVLFARSSKKTVE